VALERHNSAQEFDAMFRRHLKQGGAPVTPCLGFDADAASAYLERALDDLAQTQFEAHLAGCAACRRYVVGLARLDNGIETVTAKRPLVAAEPVWSRWYDTVAQWLDFSGWSWGWTAAAACGLLLTFFGATMWRQMSASHNAASTLVAQTMPGVAVPSQDGEPRAQASVPPTESGVAQTASSKAQPAGITTQVENRQRSTVPAPVMPPDITLNNNLAAVAPQPGVRSLIAEINNPNFGSQPSPPPPPGLTAAPVVFGASRQNLALPIGFGGAQIRRAPAQITLQPNQTEMNELVAELALPSPPRARDEAPKPAADQKTSNDPATAARARELARALKGRALSLVPIKDVEARTKEAEIKESPDQVKPLMKRLNGHTFYFDHGFWIDEEYKSDTTLPLIRLTRGSERYQQILIENPTLEQFFQLGQVIVIWKGKIYEVRK
jgi:hypothetical protein